MYTFRKINLFYKSKYYSDVSYVFLQILPVNLSKIKERKQVIKTIFHQ